MLFANDDSAEAGDESDESEEQDDEPLFRVAYKKIYTYEHSIHKGTAYFDNGTDYDVVFDGMKKGEDGITLYDYVGVPYQNMGPAKPEREAFDFIPYDNLLHFETEEREQTVLEDVRKEETVVVEKHTLRGLQEAETIHIEEIEKVEESED